MLPERAAQAYEALRAQALGAPPPASGGSWWLVVRLGLCRALTRLSPTQGPAEPSGERSEPPATEPAPSALPAEFIHAMASMLLQLAPEQRHSHVC